MKLHVIVVTTFAVALSLSSLAQATVVNVDFNGANLGDAAPGPTYVGASGAGSGTVWNGVTVDSRTGVTVGTPTGTGNDYDLTITQNDLDDDAGGSTDVDIAFNHVGGDDNPSGGNALFRDYLGAGFGGNPNAVTFTISGLGSATTANLYFYQQFDHGGIPPQNVVISGESPDTFTPTGIFTAANTVYYENVPVTAGSISGTITLADSYDILNGFSISYVPEPSSLALLGLGAWSLIAARRRTR